MEGESEYLLSTTGSLTAALGQLAAIVAKRMGPERHQVLEDFVDRLRQGRVGSGALAVGDVFPPFLLADADARLVALDDLLADGPLVLTFYRGGWCPFCSLTLTALQTVADRLAASGAKVVAISPDVGDAPSETRRNRHLSFPVLSDADNGLALACGLMIRLPDPVCALYQSYGVDLVRLHGNPAWTLPVPGSFVIDREGIVRYAHIDPDFRRRLDIEQVVRVVEGLRR
ncbi:MAG: AhpC/TSA family protein [Alphaproteobacteria bacterium]|nr:MAG: AhpC/TSA family protein [Alphaproteobacteria bacterium]